MKRSRLLLALLPLSLNACSVVNLEEGKLVTREVKRAEENRQAEFDYYNIDDSIKNKVSAVAIKSFDSSIFEEIDEVNIDNNNKVEVRYEVELDAVENVVVLKAYLNKTNEEILDTLKGAVILNDEEEYDVVFNTEDGDIYLSELEKTNTYEECGWFSRLVKTIVKAIVIAVVPPVVRPVVAVAIAATEIVEIVFSKSNYDHNKKLDHKVTDYIYTQNKDIFYDWKVGLSSNIARTGCGYIAVYNTLLSLNRRKPFSEVIYEFDRNEGKNALGFLGADPSHIGEYFNKLDIKYKKYYSYESLDNALKEVSPSQMVILCYWNSDSISNGAHYIAFNNVNYNSDRKSFSAYTFNLRKADYSIKEDFDSTKTIYDLHQGSFIASYIISTESALNN